MVSDEWLGVLGKGFLTRGFAQGVLGKGFWARGFEDFWTRIFPWRIFFKSLLADFPRVFSRGLGLGLGFEFG